VDQTTSQIAAGLCDDGETPYVPGVNCMGCGKFVGRDGRIEIAHREMSGAVASVEGTCGACMMKASAAERRLSTCQRCHTQISVETATGDRCPAVHQTREQRCIRWVRHGGSHRIWDSMDDAYTWD
jgi:hypothetical protein